MTKREAWIDIAKCIAILAVLVDHVFGCEARVGRTLFVSWSYFSVSLFVLIGGFNAGRSLLRKDGDSFWPSVPWRGIGKLFGAYLIAVAVYRVAEAHEFDLVEYLRSVCSFNAAGPFYFVAFYVQLLFVSPLIYGFLRRKPLVALALIALAAHWFTRHTTMFPLAYGGGRSLLGGYFLLTYAIGMVFALWPWNGRRIWAFAGSFGILLASVLGLAPVKDGICALNGKVGFILYNLSPGGGLWMLVAVSVFLIVRSGSGVLERVSGNVVSRVLQAVGRESMMIFLYHILVIISIDRVVHWAHPVTGCLTFVLAAMMPIFGIRCFRRMLVWWKEV